jgi:hypothetical protein
MVKARCLWQARAQNGSAVKVKGSIIDPAEIFNQSHDDISSFPETLFHAIGTHAKREALDVTSW